MMTVTPVAEGAMQDIQGHKLGETNELLTLETAADHRAVVVAMAQQAVRSLHIFTRDLDHALYDTPEFEAAALNLVRTGQYARIHILVQDSSGALRRGHRLINLAQRLSSKIEIRKPIAEYADISRAFFVADETGYVSRQMADRYEGMANFSDRLTARDMVGFFNEVWERSQQDSQLRRLHL
jgi:hypothetical protein